MRCQLSTLMLCSTQAKLSYDVASGSEITPSDKPLVVYIFSGKVMTSITMCVHNDNVITYFTPEMRFESNLSVI